jgi:phospholipid-translocating ATPase
VIFDKLQSGEEVAVDAISACLHDFSAAGLRTLVFAAKAIPEAEFVDWSVRFDEASKSMEWREENVAKVAAEVERGVRKTNKNLFVCFDNCCV